MTGNLIPEFRDIRLKGVRVVDGGNVILDGYDAARPLRMAWDDVYFDKPDAIKVKASHAAIAKGPGPSNLPITGENVELTGTTSDAPRLDCERKFVPLPANAAQPSDRRRRLRRRSSTRNSAEPTERWWTARRRIAPSEAR